MRPVYVIDTETSTTSFVPEPNGHIVEFGVVAVDLEAQRIGRSYSCIIKDAKADPQAWVFNNTSLTYEEVMNGVDPYQAAEYFARVLNGQEVTAYNVAFDKRMIDRDMELVGQVVDWGSCLMETASLIEGIPRRHGGSNRWPKAEDAYNYLCPGDPADNNGVEVHRAYDDALMEAYILIELYKRGLYEPKVEE